MRIAFAVALSFILGACAREQVKWYQLVSYEGGDFPLAGDGDEVLGGWFEVHPHQTAVLRVNARETSGEDESQVYQRAAFGAFKVTKGLEGTDSVTFVVDSPDYWIGGWSSDTLTGILSGGELSIAGEINGVAFLGAYSSEGTEHPEFIERHELVSVDGLPLPMSHLGKPLLGGWHQSYSDGTGMIVFIYGESVEGDTIQRSWSLVAPVEVAAEAENGSRPFLWGGGFGTGSLTDSTLVMVAEGGSMVFHKRR